MLRTTLAVHRPSARNSVGFLEAAFRLYAERRLFTIERGDVDPSLIPGLVVAEEHAIDGARG